MKTYARCLVLGLVLALAPCVQPSATAAVPPLTVEGLTASFDENGVLIYRTEPLPELWSWRYTLTTFGRAGLPLPALPPVLTADLDTRELVRPGLREVYEVKDTIKGFEQSFIIEQPPPGQGSILLEGRVSTDLEPEGGIRLPNRVAYLLDGLPQLQYANLAVRDATGRALAARMRREKESVPPPAGSGDDVATQGRAAGGGGSFDRVTEDPEAPYDLTTKPATAQRVVSTRCESTAGCCRSAPPT